MDMLEEKGNGTAGEVLSERLLDNSNRDYESSNPDPESQIVVNVVEQGEKQPNQYRDAWAAVLFLIQLCSVCYLGLVWGIKSLNYDPSSSSSGYHSSSTQNFGGMLGLFFISCIVTIIVSAGMLMIMTNYAHSLIQYSLMFSIVADTLVVAYFFLHKNMAGLIFSLVTLLIATAYTIRAWRRIPFAAANLVTALTAVRTNGGVTLIAFGLSIAVNIIFAALWLLAWVGVYVRYTAKTCDDGEACFSHTNPLVMLLFLLSFYWTSEVGRNVLHVTVAGVVGTWWFAPDEANTFFSPAIMDSFRRATTYSAGSICLGSLLTALLQLLNHVIREARKHGRSNDMMLCVLECISVFLERLVVYFNKWAYVYIGLYGYDYLTAGKKVMDLFVVRGWTVIMNDNLVSQVLFLVSVIVGIITGFVSLVLARSIPSWVVESSASGFMLFVFPLLIGTSISATLFGVISSAVDTVLVSFCEAPMEFERNHPGLSYQMKNAWLQIHPELFGN